MVIKCTGKLSSCAYGIKNKYNDYNCDVYIYYIVYDTICARLITFCKYIFILNYNIQNT